MFWRSLALVVLLAAPTTAAAGGRYQLVGLSPTHLAVREIYSHSECCGAEPVVDCRYEGLMALSNTLDVIRNPIERRDISRTFTGTKLVVFPYKAGALTQVPDKEEGGARIFTVYESVIEKKSCTTKETSKQRLAEAKAYAATVGIEMGTPIALVAEMKPVRPDDCLPAKPKPECASSESRPEWFVRSDISEGNTLHLFVETSDKVWSEVEVYRTGGLWLGPTLEYSGAWQFRIFMSAMSETWEDAWFFVPPAN